MTTYYQPMQRHSDKRWDMTRSTGSTKPHPIGYCAGWLDDNPWLGHDHGYQSREFADRMAVLWAEEQNALRANAHRFHTDGHETAEEASRCWNRYRLDNRLEFYEDDRTQEKCATCDQWTTGRAHVRGPIGPPPIALCRDHQTHGDAGEHLFARR